MARYFRRRKFCKFTAEGTKEIDYKDLETLKAYVSETGKIVPDTFEGEMRRSFENVAKVLAGAGLELDDVVQVRAYVRDPGDLPVYNKVYQDLFREPYPARTTLTHCLPETLRFEVEAIAQMRE